MTAAQSDIEGIRARVSGSSFYTAMRLMPKTEREAMFEKPIGTARTTTYASLKNSKTVIVSNDEHDVFGDGTVILKAAPGHTPGHQVLLVRLPKRGPVLLAGDLYHYPEERTLNRLPVGDADQEQTRRSRESLDAFLAQARNDFFAVVVRAELEKRRHVEPLTLERDRGVHRPAAGSRDDRRCVDFPTRLQQQERRGVVVERHPLDVRIGDRDDHVDSA